MSDAIDLSTGSKDDMLLVHVPRWLYPKVLRFIADELEGGENEPEHEHYRGWTRDHVVQLKSQVTNPTIHKLFELAAERGEEPISIRELEQASERSYYQVRGDLSGFGRLTANKFHLGTWPFAVEGDQNGIAQYRVPSKVSHWWQEA